VKQSIGWEKFASKFHDKFKEEMTHYKNKVLRTAEIKEIIENTNDFRGNEKWIQASDHCKNHTNKGACYCAETEEALFERIGWGQYRVL